MNKIQNPNLPGWGREEDLPKLKETIDSKPIGTITAGSITSVTDQVDEKAKAGPWRKQRSCLF